MRETQKVPRTDRKKKRRVVKKSEYKKARRIIREAPPKAEKKIVLTTEMIQNPKTGEIEKKKVYKLQEVIDPDRQKKLSKNLYIPKVAPPKERKYLRYIPPQFKDAKKRYENPNKYGDLSLYTKSRLLQIAKNKYGLTNALAKHLDKDDIQRYIKKRYKKADTFSDDDYLPKKIKLRQVEPIRNKQLTYIPDKGFNASLIYGKGNTLVGNSSPMGLLNPFEDLNIKLDANQKYKNVPRFGTFRKMSEKKHTEFLKGILPKEDMLSELITHLDIDDPKVLITLDDKQLTKLYKKTYKLSKKPDDERFVKKINFPKFKQNNSGNFGKPPIIKDTTGKPFIVGTRNISEIKSLMARRDKEFVGEDKFGLSRQEINLNKKKALKDWMINQNKGIRNYNKTHGSNLVLLSFQNIKKDIKEIMRQNLSTYEDAIDELISMNAYSGF